MRQVYREVAPPALGLDAPLGQQIRALRGERSFTLAELARRARTSARTPHRYENGWDRFELQTLKRIGEALDARLEIRLVPADSGPAKVRRPSGRTLVKMLAPLRSLTYLEDAETESVPRMLRRFRWAKVKKSIVAEVWRLS